MLIPRERLSHLDLLHMLDWLKEDWRRDKVLALTPGYSFHRLGRHLRMLPQPHRSKTQSLLGMLWTEELPADEVFVRLGLAISDWNLERKEAA